MNTKNTFLKFRDNQGKYQLVSISDVLHVGQPINGQPPLTDKERNEGEEMEMVCSSLFKENGQEIAAGCCFPE